MTEILKDAGHIANHIGIIGAGQLSLYLAAAALKQNLEVRIFCQFLDDPATHLSVAKIVDRGTDDARDLFLAGLDAVIFENEFVDQKRFEASRFQPKTFPSWAAISKLSWKSEQKELLNELQIKTAEWEICEPSHKDVDAWLSSAIKKYDGACIVKWSKFGYDGYGNFLIKDGENLIPCLEFIKEAHGREIPVYAERMISFEKELSLVSTRSTSGEISYFPLVVSQQKNGACYWVEGPARAHGIPGDVELEARVIAKKLAEATKLAGTFAVEFFWSKSLGLVVNEIAPRVHNTGHFSLSAADKSQFDQHISALRGERLSDPKTKPYFGMLNLLGPAIVHEVEAPEFPAWPNTEFFWYQKKEMRRGRKMGHLNFWADSLNEFNSLAQKVKQWENDVWQKQR